MMKKTLFIIMLSALVLSTGSLKVLGQDPSAQVSNAPLNLTDWGEYEDIKSEALQRIDQYRKGDVNLQVLLPGQRPAANSSLRAQLKRHDFLWGAVIRDVFFTSPYSATYKKNFLKYFNGTGFGIELKPKYRGSSQEATAYAGMDWLNANNIYTRGHALTWEGYTNVRPEDQAIYDNTSLTNQEKADSLLWSMGKHFHHAVPKWDVGCWDVTNEAITNNLVNALLPDYNTHAHWFRLADSIRRTCGRENVVLYANDYQIISAMSSWALNYTKSGYSAVGRPGLYREMMDEQIAAGAPIEAIGFQSRLKNGLITPDSIYKRLCDFERFKLPYHATEFEVRDSDTFTYTDEQRRQQTEFMMIMYMSHRNMQGFWHWTFFDNNSTVRDYALFNYNGTPKINGVIWMDLMDGVFNSDLSLEANAEGEGLVRGYYGNYELSATKGDSIFTGTFRIDSLQADPNTMVNLDRGFKLSGLKDRNSYPLDQALSIEIEAFSLQGNITATGLFMNKDSIGGHVGAGFNMNYTPSAAVEGWNEFILTGYDDAGNSISYTLDVYFGETLPQIEVLEQPTEPIPLGSTGNQIVFQINTDYSPVDSVIVGYAGQEYIHEEDASPFVYSLDGLPVADYSFEIRVVDQEGGQAEQSIPFSVISDENILPVVEITSPADSAVFNPGDDVTLTVVSSDEDGSITRVDLYKNGHLLLRFAESPYSTVTDTLGVGWHEFIASAMDDRGDQATDTIYISVEEPVSNMSASAAATELAIWPNPVSEILHFNQACDFEIYTIAGRKVLEGTAMRQVDVSGLEQGFYLVRSGQSIRKLRKL